MSLHGHKTSISLEKAFWSVLEKSARDQGISLSQLIQNIDETREGSLASALRVYALSKAVVSDRSSVFRKEEMSDE